ncbi:MAG TPA: dihydropteroate synthase [Aquifex aeolicus]|nr:dihydropteroate synthase [Aquificales bacterium]HIQ26239.1 dihydropteroate synthase [Aquifex aeolicus]
MELRIRNFDSYEETYRYLLRALAVHEKLVPFLAEKTNAFNILVENFPKQHLKELIKASEKSCVKVAYPTLLELAPDYITLLLIGSEYDFKTLAKELKNYPQLNGLAVELIKTVQRYKKRTFRVTYKGKVLPLGLKTHIMGIVNVTPDSFSDGGENFSTKAAVEKALKLAHEGADIIDIGGESTRPGAKPISAEEEFKRVLPVVRELKKELERQKLEKVWISVDTYKSEVANAVLQEGADIINDISGLTFDPRMVDIVIKHRAPVVVNHIKGTPQTWRDMEISYTDVVGEIISFWNKQIVLLMERGYDDRSKIICDPGIGFGKLPEHNIEILKRFDEFRVIGQPLMVGVSRKSFIGLIYETLLNKKSEAKERLFGSLGALAPAVIGGANIVRVHDVAQTREFLAVLDSIRTYDPYYFG